MDIETALQSCGGAARRPRLRALGVSSHGLRVGITRGSAIPAGRGGYALPGTDPALVAAVRLGGAASHDSAASLYGFGRWVQADVIHVTIPRGSCRDEPGVRVHRGRLGEGDLDPARPLTSPMRTLLDCGRTLPLLEAVVILDAALNAGAIPRTALLAAADAARGHGAAALRRAVRHADELAASPLESALRLLLDLLGAGVRTQVRIGGVGIVDFLLDGWLVIEADGFAYHSDRAAYRNDRRRANVLAESGYVLLRFTWEDVRLRPGWVLAQVQRVLRRGPTLQSKVATRGTSP